MCRSTTEIGKRTAPPRLKIRAFFLRLLIGDKLAASRPLPESLTLVYLPRIDGNKLEVNGAKIRAEKPAFLALHRARSVERVPGEAVFVSTDRVLVSDGARFETLLGDEKLLKGVFRRCEGEWEMECRGGEEGEVAGVAAVEIRVAGENGAMMAERVEMGAKPRRRWFCSRLEEIPEETDGCDCCCCGGEDDEGWEMVESDGEDLKEMDGVDCGVEVEGVRWAVDVGIWVMCLGVGFLVSRASSGLRRKRLI
ncbi:hypothetical protein J5N97_019047 [Dioscorea zingiberensis]|uniref:Uncharacterized protein n=1 Tax=Dioscorea zingiberensis TaxID=325984 RepID=A0A9D5HCH7_9LILI|nr:hypothetical protein J5N97_019047 [Dioscorea zingiberensis]